MKRLMIVFASCFSACSSPEYRFVDMEYRVHALTSEDTCVDEPDLGEYAFFDVSLKADERMTLSYLSPFVPGTGLYEDLEIYGNQVDLVATGPSPSGFGDEEHRITGGVTEDYVDLTIDEHRWRYDTEEAVPCVRKARMIGGARHFSDTTKIDGKYEAEYALYDFFCFPGVPKMAPPRFRWKVPLDIREYADHAVFSFNSHDEEIRFEMPKEAYASGYVSWQGPMEYNSSRTGFTPLMGSIVGIFQGGEYGLQIIFRGPGEPEGCGYPLDVGGAKRFPDPTRVENVYRMVSVKTDTCKAGSPRETVEEEGDIVFHPDGRLTIMHGIQRFDLPMKSPGVYGAEGSSGGVRISAQVEITPPNLHFTYAYVFDTQGGGTCSESYEITGVPRFVSDLTLVPPPNAEFEMKDAKPRKIDAQQRPMFETTPTLRGFLRLP